MLHSARLRRQLAVQTLSPGMVSSSYAGTTALRRGSKTVVNVNFEAVVGCWRAVLAAASDFEVPGAR